MNRTEILNVLAASMAGELRFPEVVGRLLAAGVESYFVDYREGRVRIYGTAGGVLETGGSIGAVPAAFDGPAVVAAIRRAQRDEVRYPEFVRLTEQAGVAGYWAFLTGKRVVYVGRDGEMHVEMFPQHQAANGISK